MKNKLIIYDPIKLGLKFRGKNQKKNVETDNFLQQIFSFPLWKVLYQFYGINRSFSFFFCTFIGYSPLLLYVKIRNSFNLNKLASFFFEYKYLFDYNLLKKNMINMAHVIDMMSLRGSKHRNHLPTRGQRTHSNYKTAKKNNKNWMLELKTMIK